MSKLTKAIKRVLGGPSAEKATTLDGIDGAITILQQTKADEKERQIQLIIQEAAPVIGEFLVRDFLGEDRAEQDKQIQEFKRRIAELRNE